MTVSCEENMKGKGGLFVFLGVFYYYITFVTVVEGDDKFSTDIDLEAAAAGNRSISYLRRIINQFFIVSMS